MYSNSTFSFTVGSSNYFHFTFFFQNLLKGDIWKQYYYCDRSIFMNFLKDSLLHLYILYKYIYPFRKLVNEFLYIIIAETECTNMNIHYILQSYHSYCKEQILKEMQVSIVSLWFLSIWYFPFVSYATFSSQETKLPVVPHTAQTDSL